MRERVEAQRHQDADKKSNDSHWDSDEGGEVCWVRGLRLFCGYVTMRSTGDFIICRHPLVPLPVRGRGRHVRSVYIWGSLGIIAIAIQDALSYLDTYLT